MTTVQQELLDKFNKFFKLDTETGYLTRKFTLNNKFKLGERVGCDTSEGYRRVKTQKTYYYEHFVVYAMHYSIFCNGIDHKDGNKANNKPTNLRPATQNLNGCNRNININNTSGVTGVTWIPARQKWLAFITVDEKMKDLGAFDHIESAAIARRNAELFYFGEFAPPENELIKNEI